MSSMLVNRSCCRRGGGLVNHCFNQHRRTDLKKTKLARRVDECWLRLRWHDRWILWGVSVLNAVQSAWCRRCFADQKERQDWFDTTNICQIDPILSGGDTHDRHCWIMNWRWLASDDSRRNKLSSYWYIVTHIEILLILTEVAEWLQMVWRHKQTRPHPVVSCRVLKSYSNFWLPALPNDS